MISVITPTYNRANLLEALFRSLAKQTIKNFEWILVDDGSTDCTTDIISRFENNDLFDFAYLKKPNGGKHTAINLGVRHAKGDLVLILDSDDTLPRNAIETISRHYDLCKNREDCGGVCGVMAHHDGARIGTGLGRDTLYVSTLDLRYEYGVKGDLLEVFKTSVLREFPFPEITGEKFCPEALVWNRIATKYKLYCFNEVVYYRDYLEGGLTDRIVKIRMDSPRASMMTYQELTEYDIPFKDKLKAAVNYWRFRFCAKGDNTPSIDYKWYFAIPFGYLMHLKDIRTTKS